MLISWSIILSYSIFCEGNLSRGGAGRTSSLLHSSRSAPGGENKNGDRVLLGIFVGQQNWVFDISRFSWRNTVGKILGETLKSTTHRFR